jgi:hypothetical protein
MTSQELNRFVVRAAAGRARGAPEVDLDEPELELGVHVRPRTSCASPSA